MLLNQAVEDMSKKACEAADERVKKTSKNKGHWLIKAKSFGVVKCQ